MMTSCTDARTRKHRRRIVERGEGRSAG
jgi:hypothetical protein